MIFECSVSKQFIYSYLLIKKEKNNTFVSIVA